MESHYFLLRSSTSLEIGKPNFVSEHFWNVFPDGVGENEKEFVFQEDTNRPHTTNYTKENYRTKAVFVTSSR